MIFNVKPTFWVRILSARLEALSRRSKLLMGGKTAFLFRMLINQNTPAEIIQNIWYVNPNIKVKIVVLFPSFLLPIFF